MQSLTRKKVLYVITKSNWGGAQRYVYDLATRLAEAGAEVAVAQGGTGEAGAPGGPLAKHLAEAGIRTIPVPSFARDLGFKNDVGAFLELKRIIRTERSDIVHLNSSKAGFLGALAARSLGTRHIIFTAHGWPFAEKRNPLWRAVAWLGSWATALLVHTIIVVSRNDLRLGEHLPFCKKKMRLIHNGINLDAPLGSGAIIRRAFPPGAHITGTIGELNRNKNQIALVEAARRDPALSIAIVGEGEDRAYLERKIKEYGLESRVKLFGFIPTADVLRGFDAFALPSLKEGLPYVLLEAKAAGLPIVLTNRVGGIGEILDAPDLKEFSIEKMIEKTASVYSAN